MYKCECCGLEVKEIPRWKKKFPELQKGIRVQFVDKDEKIRTERIHSRRGNTITVINENGRILKEWWDR